MKKNTLHEYIQVAPTAMNPKPILAGFLDTGRSPDFQVYKTTRPNRCSGSGVNFIYNNLF